MSPFPLSEAKRSQVSSAGFQTAAYGLSVQTMARKFLEGLVSVRK